MIRSVCSYSVHLLVALAATFTLSSCVSPNTPTVAELALSSDPAGLPPDGSVTIKATVLTSGGAPVSGVQVSFTTSAGSLSAVNAGTDAEGIARVQLTTSEPATVRAKVQEREAILALRRQTTIELIFSNPAPRRNELITVVMRFRTAGQEATGQLSLSFGDGETLDLGQVTGEATVTHRWRDEGDFDFTVTLREGPFETQATTRLEIRGLGPLDDHIDASQVIWLSPATTNVSDWAVTSEVHSISINGDTVCIDHSKAGQWPLVSIDDNPPNIEANILIVINVDGQWYGGGYDWLGGGRICKSVDPSEFGRDQIRVPPLDASWHGPRSGETVGLLITTPSSNRIPVRSVNERTPITLVTWP
ncbi:MAG TPA: Ig-like domain-containing protein [Vicinamibacterales bacterium]|nr:Ig-like domain-containing protein [Vicinamibacterales bacterium]